jgi:alpha-mannosidase
VHLPLEETERTETTASLRAELAPQPAPVAIRYRTRTGALLRVDGVAAGAFDREHDEVVLAPSPRVRTLTFEVELHALPTNGLPSGDGIVWWYLNARAHQAPAQTARVEVRTDEYSCAPANGTLAVIGHSHLDVAWLWTYGETARKAERTFAIACELLDRDASFHFLQSQPQLYRFVEERDPQLFDRVRAYVKSGRFDPDGAALWVESDCNIPSGESLLRQMIAAHAYCTRRFGVTPRIAWLPDTFGFARTLPQLLAHAGIPYFATTKLEWNDTTKFPYPQFVWEGADGSSVVAALLQSYDGGPYPWRVAKAKRRNEPLIVGYGDGGGGVTSKMLRQVDRIGTWIRAADWFESLVSRHEKLPRHRDELYLEYHRGVYTTHHDVKAHNALLERALVEAEEVLSWCIAVHAPRGTILGLIDRLASAWEIVLRNQFHDVLPGTSITPVYEDAEREYAHAEELVAGVLASAQSMLPRAPQVKAGIERSEPQERKDDFVFENGLIRATVQRTGEIVQLGGTQGGNVCTRANVLTLYRDKPRAWEAWNIDRGYDRTAMPVQAHNARVEGGCVAIDVTVGSSTAQMCLALFAGEPFLRVDLNVEWRERRRLLRVENSLAVQSDRVVYGAPHGTIERSALSATPAQAAKFEVPGQRYAAARDAAGNGVAILALDTYGWNARVLPSGCIHVGHSLLRGTTWPDRSADLGEHHVSYAFAPLRNAGTGGLERAWIAFAHEQRVRLFTCEDEAVLVVACKPAQDYDGVVVRVRECDGSPRTVRLRCGARMTHAQSVDALERSIERAVDVEQEWLVFDMSAFELRSFRVRFSHES